MTMGALILFFLKIRQRLKEKQQYFPDIKKKLYQRSTAR